MKENIFLKVLQDLANKRQDKSFELIIPSDEEYKARLKREQAEVMTFIKACYEVPDEELLYKMVLQLRQYERAEILKLKEYTKHCPRCSGMPACSFALKELRPKICVVVSQDEQLEFQIKYTPFQCPKNTENRTFTRLFKRSGLAPSQALKTFDNFAHVQASTDVTNAKACAFMAAEERTSLIISGKQGSGKSHLATAIALKYLNRGEQAIFILASELNSKIRQANLTSPDAFEKIFELYCFVPCLIIDDLGKDKPTPASMDNLFRIIDTRYRYKLATIITTNLDLTGLFNLSTDFKPIISRLIENGQFVKISNAEDYRLKLQHKNLKE